MFRCVLLAVLCLVPGSAFAIEGPAEINFGTGLYWRYLVVWPDDPDDQPITYWVQGFFESGVRADAIFSYKNPYNDMGEPNLLPPSFELRATNFDNAERVDTDGDFDIDVDDLNIVRNEFGKLTIHDITGDGLMGVEDLNEVRNEFGIDFFSIPPQPWEPIEGEFGVGEFSFWSTGEVLDGCVTLNDGRFGPAVTPCAAGSPVPEPSSLLLAGIAIMALSRRIWSRCRQS